MRYTLWAMERAGKRAVARLVLWPLAMLTCPIAAALDWISRKAWEWRDG